MSDLTLINSPRGYTLLKKYMREAKVLSTAYGYSEAYYRGLHKYLTYPIIITSAVASMCAGLNINQYVLLGLSLSTLILSGFNSAVNPKEKENNANKMAVEFGEIHSGISQFIYENDKSKNDIRAYSQLVHELLNTWKSQAPSISDKFIKRAKLETMDRMRQSIKKKDEFDEV